MIFVGEGPRALPLKGRRRGRPLHANFGCNSFRFPYNFLMPKTISVKAVIFDMDGVITNTMPDHYKAWHKVMLDEGISVTHHDIYSREGQRGYWSVFELFEKYGRKTTTHHAKELLLKKEKLFKKIVKQRFIVGSRKLLKDLARDGFELALVTGTAHHEAKKILPKSLYSLFSVIITGDMCHHGKPHPEPYLKAIKALKIKKTQGIVIENAPFGIQSAKDAGLKCIALETSLPRKYLKKADYIFHTVKELREKINLANSH